MKTIISILLVPVLMYVPFWIAGPANKHLGVGLMVIALGAAGIVFNKLGWMEVGR